LSYGRVVYLF